MNLITQEGDYDPFSSTFKERFSEKRILIQKTSDEAMSFVNNY
jgi:hypothetical protein